jgi:hypothetical protein
MYSFAAGFAVKSHPQGRGYPAYEKIFIAGGAQAAVMV